MDATENLLLLVVADETLRLTQLNSETETLPVK